MSDKSKEEWQPASELSGIVTFRAPGDGLCGRLASPCCNGGQAIRLVKNDMVDNDI